MYRNNILFITLLFMSINVFAQTDMSLVPYRSGDKWGYASPDKKIVIQPKYNEASWFAYGFAAVKVGNKYGYINKAGTLVIPARFTVAKPFKKGYLPKLNKEGGDSVLFAGASLSSTGYENCIDSKGRVMAKCPAINENSVAEENQPVATIVKQKTYSLQNNGGLFDKIIDDYQIPGSEDRYYIAEKHDSFGVFNARFDTIVPFEYSAIKKIKSGQNEYLQVAKSNMSGVLSLTGQTLINANNSSLTIVNANNHTDYAIVKHEGSAYLKDLKNNNILPNGYTDIVYDSNGGFVLFDKDNLEGFYFLNGKMIAPKYSEIHLLPDGEYLLVKNAMGKSCYVNQNGDEFFVE